MLTSDDNRESPPVAPAEADGVARLLAPLLAEMFPGGVPVRVAFWDGTSTGPSNGPDLLRVTSPRALQHLLWSPGELGLARAFVAGDLDFEGNMEAVLRAFEDGMDGHSLGPRAVARILAAAREAGALKLPPPRPPEEARPRGWRHSKQADAEAIRHHYDVGNDFYRLVLGARMTYSCARFVSSESTLEQAQDAKHDLICRKLGLHERPGQRLLDVGCGWGSMAIHAAQHHEARVVGITISAEQAALARLRVEEAGVADRVEIRIQDYRDLAGETFDAISSIGMSEHVGSNRVDTYFTTLRALLPPYGRMLNHAISSVGGSKIGRRSFIGRYVFPDGELLDVSDTVRSMETAGFEVRDVESLREHYATTLRAWIANLEGSWDDAVALVGVGRARVWRLYMTASALGFDDGGVSLHQVLGVVPDEHGNSRMPRTRETWK